MIDNKFQRGATRNKLLIRKYLNKYDELVIS